MSAYRDGGEQEKPEPPATRIDEVVEFIKRELAAVILAGGSFVTLVIMALVVWKCAPGWEAEEREDKRIAAVAAEAATKRDRERLPRAETAAGAWAKKMRLPEPHVVSCRVFDRGDIPCSVSIGSPAVVYGIVCERDGDVCSMASGR